MLNKTVW